MKTQVTIDGKLHTLDVPDDVTPEEMDEIVNAEFGAPPSAGRPAAAKQGNPFDVVGAKAAGYSTKEITEHLAKEQRFDIAGARAAMYSDDEIANHLAAGKTSAAVEYIVTGPDGQEYEVTAPAGANEQEVIAYAQRQFPSAVAATPTAHTAPTPEPAKMGMAQGIVRQFQRGITLGFDDEISGFGDALLAKMSGDSRSLGDIYSERRAGFDSARQGFASAHPTVAALAEGTGNAAPAAAAILSGNPELIPGAVPAMKQAANSIIGRVGRNAALGGATGATAGYGNADPGHRTEGALQGGAAGALIGGAGGAAVEAIVPAVSGLRAPAARVASYLDEIIKGKPTTPAARPAQPLASPGAQQKILQAFERDGLTPVDVAARLKQQQKLGKPAGIATVAGENTRSLGPAAATAPGPGKQIITNALNDRAAMQQGRVLGDVEQGVGMKASDTDEVARQIIATRAAHAKPAYTKAYAQGEITHPDLISLMDGSAAFAQPHNKARALLGGAGKNVPELYSPETGQLVRYPTVEDIDLIKKGFDRRLYNSKRGVNDHDEPALDKYFASELEKHRTALLSTADPLAPDYAKARAGFAGETAMHEALEGGREFLSMDARQATRTLAVMNPEQRGLFRLGAVDAIRQRLATAADRGEYASVVQSIFGSGRGSKRDQLATLFPDADAFARFESQMQSELQMATERNHVLGGSQTANKLSELDDLNSAADAVIGSMGGGGWKDLVMKPLRAVGGNALARVRAGYTEATRKDVAENLFNFDKAEQAQDFLRKLEETRLTREASQRTKRVFGAGASVYGALTAEAAGP